MAYTSMKKLITKENQQYDAGEVTAVEYNNFKTQSMNKLDVFLTCNRITDAQYEELMGMLKTVA